MTLTYCDMTTGPAGEVITYEERLAGVERRYGPDHVVARSVRQARAEVERCTEFVESRLREGSRRPSQAMTGWGRCSR